MSAKSGEMAIRILCIGDVIGKPGRHVVMERLGEVVKEQRIDFVIANSENAAAGSGLTPPLFEKLRRYGVDVCTMGDHTYRRRELLPVLESSDRLIRPANFPVEAVGRGHTIVKTAGGVSVAVIQIMGRVNMTPHLDCPFHAIDRILAELPREVKVRVVDFHAEVSSEKIAMGWHLDGRVSLNFGTHTHTPTADARVLPGGTAYVSDLGMTGPYDSILGRRKDVVLKHMITGMHTFFDVATGDPRMCGVIAEIDDQTGKALSITRCDVAGTQRVDAYDADDGKGRS